jgi:hypothetical protein
MDVDVEVDALTQVCAVRCEPISRERPLRMLTSPIWKRGLLE